MFEYDIDNDVKIIEDWRINVIDSMDCMHDGHMECGLCKLNRMADVCRKIFSIIC